MAGKEGNHVMNLTSEYEVRCEDRGEKFVGIRYRWLLYIRTTPLSAFSSFSPSGPEDEGGLAGYIGVLKECLVGVEKLNSELHQAVEMWLSRWEPILAEGYELVATFGEYAIMRRDVSELKMWKWGTWASPGNKLRFLNAFREDKDLQGYLPFVWATLESLGIQHVRLRICVRKWLAEHEPAEGEEVA